jgi:tripartite-type tricarboxylate transporter receptor subunit TctC
MTSRKTVVTALAVMAAAITLSPAGADAAESFYKGKTLRFVVGAGVGGGYDAYARMLGPLYAQQLDATVVVENIPGGGGLRALNKLAAEPGDGLSIHVANGAATSLTQLLEMPGAKYDLTKFEFLGIADYSRWNVLVTPKSPYNSLADLIKADRKISWGASGKISGLSDGAAFTCHVLGLKCRLVTGYKGSAAAALAVAQGEMDALYVSETSAFNYVRAKNAKALATVNRKRSILFPDLPTIFEQLPNLTAEQAWWIDMHSTIESLGRILVAPPGTPKARVDELVAVTHKILSDPKVVEAGAKKKRFIKYIPAAEAKAAMMKVLGSMGAEQKARVKKVVLKTY